MTLALESASSNRRLISSSSRTRPSSTGSTASARGAAGPDTAVQATITAPSVMAAAAIPTRTCVHSAGSRVSSSTWARNAAASDSATARSNAAHRRRRVASQGEQDDAEPDQGRDDTDRGSGTNDLDSLHTAPSLSLPDTIPLFNVENAATLLRNCLDRPGVEAAFNPLE